MLEKTVLQKKNKYIPDNATDNSDQVTMKQCNILIALLVIIFLTWNIIQNINNQFK